MCPDRSASEFSLCCRHPGCLPAKLSGVAAPEQGKGKTTTRKLRPSGAGVLIWINSNLAHGPAARKTRRGLPDDGAVHGLAIDADQW
jgi:hypothetical protein